MRSAVLQLPASRTASDRRQVLRSAMRQLERAEIYLAAIAYMELDDRPARRAVSQLRADLDALRRHLGDLRSST
jgi:acyl-CoA reductase-like NAD-dependent aldehyde dehydrogenase